MVGHQTVRPYLDSCSTSLLGEQIAINVVVPVLEKYSLPPVPALGKVMRKAGNHHAGKARHLGKLPQRKEKGDRYHGRRISSPTGAVDNSRSRLRTRVSPNVGFAVATQAGRLGAGEGTMKAGRQQSARLSREGRMIGDLALSARRLRFSE
jgi:hypothetical protein